MESKTTHTKLSNELSISDLHTGRYVTVVRGAKLSMGGEDQSYQGQVLTVLATDRDSNYAILKQVDVGYVASPITFWLGNWGFADASILDKPDVITVTTEEVNREGKKPLLAAVEVSLKKYRQVYEASDAELEKRGKVIIWGEYCGLCQTNPSGCTLDCLLNDGTDESCCPEWRAVRDSWGNWPVFRTAVLVMIERLEQERDKLLHPPIQKKENKKKDLIDEKIGLLRISETRKNEKTYPIRISILENCQQGKKIGEFGACYSKPGNISGFTLDIKYATEARDALDRIIRKHADC